MSRPLRFWLIVPGLVAASALAHTGCDYTSEERLRLPGEDAARTAATGDRAGASAPARGGDGGGGVGVGEGVEKSAILDNVMKLIESAAVTPGGPNIGNATKNLNQYFEGTPAESYRLDPEARAFLAANLPSARVEDLETPTWTMPDARHLEDCMLYQGIAHRVAGKGDDLTRARRVFDWMVQQIQLVPAGSLAAPNLGQAYARPYDVLLRGLATEGEAGWSERGWLFLALCRQLGLDAGLVTYTPRGAKTPIIWCVAVLVDKTPYLFDARIGLPIPGADGTGVATLDEAMTQREVLDRMDLNIADQPAYTSRAALRNSTTRLGVLLDSSLRYFSPRMKLLQHSLAGKDLTILYRDPAAQRDRFVEAFGPRLGKVGLWDLPMTVETLLFTSPQFVESTKIALGMFAPELPLLYARMKQLRGETLDAVRDYVAFRFAENATLMDRKTLIHPEAQKVLDVYATYFLGLCQLDLKDPDRAAFFFEKTLELVPEPGPRRPYFYMFRWGAQANLGRLKAARGDDVLASAYFSLPDPTPQRHGNLLRARDLVWRNPLSPSPAPLPAAPPDTMPPPEIRKAGTQ